VSSLLAKITRTSTGVAIPICPHSTCKGTGQAVLTLEAMSAERTVEELLTDFPYLEDPDIREALASLKAMKSGSRVVMRFLIDMNLTPRWVQYLRSAGYEAIHWSSVGPLSAPRVRQGQPHL